VRLPPSPVPRPPIVHEVEQFATDHRLADRAAEIDRNPAFPTSEFRAMGKAGLLGLSVPRALGGRGLPLRESAAALYWLARRGGTAFAKLSLQPEFCSVLADHGSVALIDAHYRPLTRGESLVGNQITEPGAGSDAGGLQTTARREGEEYVLNGIKSEAAFVSNAQSAIVYARTDETRAGPGGITALVVPQSLARCEPSSSPDLGERWMGRGRVVYDRVKVPIVNRIGEEGRAFDYVRPELTRERAILGAIYLGVARASWEETVAHVGERSAFGRPLSSQEAVSFPLVEDWAQAEAVWYYLEKVVERLEAGEPVEAEAALAKWLATECALRTIDHAIQFHGGRGYSGELPHERRWRDVRSGAIAHGPSEIMRWIAARSLWPTSRNSRTAPDAAAAER
jgi:alkylation response protein AidB-like acyl-CoA dehydrogenase